MLKLGKAEHDHFDIIAVERVAAWTERKRFAKKMKGDVLMAPAARADYPGAFATMRVAGAEGLGDQRGARVLPRCQATGETRARGAAADRVRMVGNGARGVSYRARPQPRGAAQAHGQSNTHVCCGPVPGDIAIERPTVIKFIGNQKILKSLALSIPLGVLAQADEVID